MRQAVRDRVQHRHPPRYVRIDPEYGAGNVIHRANRPTLSLSGGRPVPPPDFQLDTRERPAPRHRVGDAFDEAISTACAARRGGPSLPQSCTFRCQEYNYTNWTIESYGTAKAIVSKQTVFGEVKDGTEGQ